MDTNIETIRGVLAAMKYSTERVEAALAAATERSDFAPFEALIGVLSRPYQDDPALAAYAGGPLEEERVRQTFCGT